MLNPPSFSLATALSQSSNTAGHIDKPAHKLGNHIFPVLWKALLITDSCLQAADSSGLDRRPNRDESDVEDNKERVKDLSIPCMQYVFFAPPLWMTFRRTSFCSCQHLHVLHLGQPTTSHFAGDVADIICMDRCCSLLHYGASETASDNSIRHTLTGDDAEDTYGVRQMAKHEALLIMELRLSPADCSFDLAARGYVRNASQWI